MAVHASAVCLPNRDRRTRGRFGDVASGSYIVVVMRAVGIRVLKNKLIPRDEPPPRLPVARWEELKEELAQDRGER